jgi:hypothetical protein
VTTDRSGITWTGKMISNSKEVGYIHEPFNIDEKISINPSPFIHWFQYISEENGNDYLSTFENIINFRYPLINNIVKISSVKEFKYILEEQIYYYKIKNKRPLIKDPISLFSTEWLKQHFNFDIVILIRHPAAFCSSLKYKEWTFDFRNFLDQPLLMKDVLLPFQKEIKKFAGEDFDIINQAILLWNCFHYTIIRYQDKYPEWTFIKHEDLSRDPITQFHKIFDKLGLAYTSEIQNKIRESSGEHNPVEQGNQNEFIRNSKANINNWKNRLTEEEIYRIREGTRKISDILYSEKDW